MDQSAERLLVEQSLAGHRGAFDELVGLHYRMIFRVAYRWCGNRADAEDIAQDALIRFARGLPRFRFESSLTTWIYRVTVSAAQDWQRRNARHARRRAVLHDGIPAAPHDDGHSAAWSREIAVHIAALPGGERAALLLVAGEGLSYAEAAAILGCSAGAIGARLHSARAKLKFLIDDGERDER